MKRIALALFITLPLLAQGRVDVIVLSCSGCSDDPPENRYGSPTCAEERLLDALIENRADPSTTRLLEQRFDTAYTLRERHRIAGALLGRAEKHRDQRHPGPGPAA